MYIYCFIFVLANETDQEKVKGKEGRKEKKSEDPHHLGEERT